jgi:hypothetical protein
MKIIKLLYLCLFVTTSLCSQHYSVEIFRINKSLNSNFWYKYAYSQLLLEKDSTFTIFTLYYNNKQELRKNILLDLNEQKGNWSTNKDTLILTTTGKASKSGHIKFIKKAKNDYIEEIIKVGDIELRKLKWKKYR